MSEYARLVISVDSTQVKKGESALLCLGRASSAVEKNVDALTSAAKRLAGPLATFLSVREVYRATEAYELLSNLVYDHQAAFLSD